MYINVPKKKKIFDIFARNLQSQLLYNAKYLNAKPGVSSGGIEY